jgi:hypothetical protein
VFDEDFVSNSWNLYQDFESLFTAGQDINQWFFNGSQCSSDGTLHHSGSNSLKIDNTGAVANNNWAGLTVWEGARSTPPIKMMMSGWSYIQQISGTNAGIFFPTDTASVNFLNAGTEIEWTGDGTGPGTTGPYLMQWFNGSVFAAFSTTYSQPHATWHKLTLRTTFTKSTTTSATFVVPAVGSTVSVNVADTSWMAVNQKVIIDDNSHRIEAFITAIADATHFTAQTNFIYLGASGATMASSATVTEINLGITATQALIDNASKQTGMSSLASGGMARQVAFYVGSSSGSTNSIQNFDDFYLTQWVANIPVVTFGSEVIVPVAGLNPLPCSMFCGQAVKRAAFF